MNLAGAIGGGLEAAAKTQLSKEAQTKNLAGLKKACEQFEAVFAKKLLGEMRKGVQETPLGDSAGSEIYRDMMDQALADAMASQGALGISKMLYKQFENQVAAAVNPPAPGGEIGGSLHSDGKQ